MQKSNLDNHSYLGNDLYAEFDGYGIWLRTGDHRDDRCENKVYLEPNVLADLNSFYSSQRKVNR